MPFDPQCNLDPVHGTELTCPDIIREDEIAQMPSRGEGLRDYVYYLFSQLNKARADPQGYGESGYIQIEASRLQLDEWEPIAHDQQFIWSKGISRAIRHYLNEKGACFTYGDSYGWGLEDVLRLYYADSFSNLEVLEVTSPELFFYPDSMEDSAIFALDYILSQIHIDNSLFTDRHNLHMGIGCACADETHLEEGEQGGWTCIFAVANRIKERTIKEN